MLAPPDRFPAILNWAISDKARSRSAFLRIRLRRRNKKGYMTDRTIGFRVLGVLAVASLLISSTISNGPGYNQIDDEATPLTKRQIVNYTGTGITCVDNAGALRTDCTINASPTITFAPPFVTDGSLYYGPVFSLTRPTDTSFSWRNQVTASITATNGMVYINSGAGTGGYTWRIREATATIPYTLTVGGNCTALISGQMFCGPVIVESGSGKLMTFGLGFSYERINVDTWNSVTSFNGNPFDGGSFQHNWAFGNLWFFRIQNDAANRFYSISKDNINFLQVYTEAAGTFITEDRVGFGVAQNVGATGFTTMSVFHFAVSNP